MPNDTVTLPQPCKCGHPRGSHPWDGTRGAAGFKACGDCACARYVPDWPAAPREEGMGEARLTALRSQLAGEAVEALRAIALAGSKAARSDYGGFLSTLHAGELLCEVELVEAARIVLRARLSEKRAALSPEETEVIRCVREALRTEGTRLYHCDVRTLLAALDRLSGRSAGEETNGE